MDFATTPRLDELINRVREFMDEHVYPVEAEAMEALDDEVTVGSDVAYPEIILELREKARDEGLWNLFLADEEHGAGLTNWEYGLLCEEMGRSPVVAPMAFNCVGPRHRQHRDPPRARHRRAEGEVPRAAAQRRHPLLLLDDRARRSPAPTRRRCRPAPSSTVDGEWVINGHKWFTSGAVGADFAIAMVVTDPDAHPYARASMIIVPTDTPGFDLVRPISVMGHDERPRPLRDPLRGLPRPRGEPARRRGRPAS